MDNGTQIDVQTNPVIVPSKMTDIGSLTKMEIGHISPLTSERLLALEISTVLKELVMRPRIEMESGPSFHSKKEREMVDTG